MTNVTATRYCAAGPQVADCKHLINVGQTFVNVTIDDNPWTARHISLCQLCWIRAGEQHTLIQKETPP